VLSSSLQKELLFYILLNATVLSLQAVYGVNCMRSWEEFGETCDENDGGTILTYVYSVGCILSCSCLVVVAREKSESVFLKNP
jgi:hypothetical protein